MDTEYDMPHRPKSSVKHALVMRSAQLRDSSTAPASGDGGPVLMTIGGGCSLVHSHFRRQARSTGSHSSVVAVLKSAVWSRMVTTSQGGGASWAAVASRWASCPGIQFGLLTPQPRLSPSRCSCLPGLQWDEVCLEFSDHGQHVEQQSADPIGNPWRFLQREIDGQLPAEALKFTDAEQSPTRQESAAGYRLQGGDIGVGLLILRQSGVGSERYVRLLRTRSSGDRYDRDMAQSRVQRVDAHDDRRVQPEVVEVDVPHFTAEGFRQ